MDLVITNNKDITNVLYNYIDVKNIIVENNIQNVEATIMSKNMDCIDKIIIDITRCGEKENILKIVSKIKVIYNIKIIIVALGYKVGDKLLSDLFNLGIYDFIISEDKSFQDEEIRKALKGNNYIDALKYKIKDEKLQKKNKINKLKEKSIKKVAKEVSNKKMTSFSFGDLILNCIGSIGYIVLTILVSIGATAIFNANIRAILLDILKGGVK